MLLVLCFFEHVTDKLFFFLEDSGGPEKGLLSV